ncbi:MAG: threonylcarbamoyladenosine tRNA methylthiotransferase MtaB [Clostridia bacterium]|nr:MiaB-like tRNA modifying enzyme [Clostridiales bacterium]MDK2984987.1 threonylcarbamoyladenosine tRNA methylthiotransferase MtaB [Clostridia bacterium]
MKKKCAFHVLGCKVNQNEVEALKNIFRKEGYVVVPFHEKADVYVIHTCTVTHISDRKSRQFIRKAIKNNPEAVVAVTGCYAQVSPHEIAKIPGVDIIIGTKDRHRIVQLVEEVKEKNEILNLVDESKFYKEFEELPLANPDRARAFLKVQEGCDRYCTYCIIPYARGPVRSRDPESTITEVKKLVSQGYLEVVLTGIHTALYGKDFADEDVDLSWLIERLAKIDGLKRLRVSSIDPDDFTPRLLKVMTENPVVCPHFHIPLQSGDDRILKKMGRRYTTADYESLVEEIKKRKPGAAITTDIMVGFPGEDEEKFTNSYKFVEKMPFSDLHVFKYSKRQGTPAAKMKDQVEPAVKNERSEKLIKLAEGKFSHYAANFLGCWKEVLVERKLENGYWEGHTDNYLPVQFSAHGDADLGCQLVNVCLKKVEGKKIIGKI